MGLWRAERTADMREGLKSLIESKANQMGRTPAIDSAMGVKLQEAVSRLGSRRKAASELGLSIGSVNRYFESLAEEAAPVMSSPARAAQRRAVVITADLWDTRRALDANYARAVALYEQLEAGLVLEEHSGPDGSRVSQVPIRTHIAALAEIREHIKLAVGISAQLLSLEAIQQFQAAVIEAIGQTDGATRDRVIAALQRNGALVGPALGPGGAEH